MAGAVELHGRITGLFGEKLNVEVPSIDTDLYETGALDSMAFVELLAFLEREFGISPGLDDFEIDSFRTIRKIAEFVLTRSGFEKTA